MCIITLRYIPINYTASFLSIKQTEIEITYYKIAFFTHVYSSIFVLFFGAFQFSNYLRKNFVKLHRLFGKAYILLVLSFSSTSGLVIGIHANGGNFSKLAFIILSVLWFYFTYKAYQYAKLRNWQLHKNFMYRSYALTLSAISLRLIKWIIANSTELSPMDTYRIVAWAGWVVNLIIAEGLIYYNYKFYSKTKSML